MKRRRTALIAFMVAAATATLGMAGCSSSGSGNGGMTIKLVGADYGTGAANSTQKYWQDIADAFHKQNPKITVNVDTINWTDYDTKVKNQIQGRHYPDILQGEFFPQYATDGLTVPIKDIADPSTGISTFTEGFSVKGAQYALPFTTSARAMFYNKKAFAAAGISGPPKTWAELEADAKLLKAKGYIGYALPLGSEEPQAESYLWMLGNGGGWKNGDKYAINSSQNIETFTFLKKLVNEGVTEPNPATYNRSADSQTDFAAGKVGIEFNGPFLTKSIADAGKLSESDYGTAAVPGKTGPVLKTLGVADAIQVFKTSDKTKLAAIKKFMAFAMNDANQLKFSKLYALLPGTQSAISTLENDPVLGIFVKTLPNTVLFPSDANWTATVLPAVKQSIGTAVTGNPSEVLGDLQNKATSGS